MIPLPPKLSDLRAGTKLVAGAGFSTVLPDLDFETYSEAGFVWNGVKWEALPRASKGQKGLNVVGAARYAEHPTTEILCLAYDLKDGRGRRLWKPGDPPPQDLFDHIAAGGLLEAWNVGFERKIWEKVCVGWPRVPRAQWRCAMAKARAHALPGKLDNAAKVLGTIAQKDKRGKQLLDLYSVPRQPTKKNLALRNLPVDPALYDYCDQDIVTEAEISSHVPDLLPFELEYWQADQEINERGVQIDLEAVQACIAIVEAALARYNAELHTLTGGAVGAASEIQKLSTWLHGQGVHLNSLAEEDVQAALKDTTLPPAAARALEIRALVGSASVKKLFAMSNSACADGRLRDLFSFHGARTGRTTGGGPQPTNLPNSGPSVLLCDDCCRHFGAGKAKCPWCGGVGSRYLQDGSPVLWGAEAVEDALLVLKSGSLALAEMFFGEALPAISGCLRGMFVAAPGHDLVCSDYSAIEAVVLAELAGEKWRQEVFRTHGKIYEASAARELGIPIEEVTKEQRKTFKVMELACGYGGGVGSMIAFGAGEFMTEDQMAASVRRWRAASPAIVEFWGGQRRKNPATGRWEPEMFGIEGAAVQAVLYPGKEFGYRGITYRMIGDALYCRLLSGRYLTYHRPRLSPSTRRFGEHTLSFEGWNTNPKSGPVGWIRMDTYGPKLVENIDQGTARDIQSHGIVAQEKAGYHIALHVYDENIAEVPEGWGSVEEFERIMTTLPAWCADWPVRAAGGWRGKRYRKD